METPFCFVCEKQIPALTKADTKLPEREFLLKSLLKVPYSLDLAKQAYLCKVCLFQVQKGIEIWKEVDKLQKKFKIVENYLLRRVKGLKNTALKDILNGKRSVSKESKQVFVVEDDVKEELKDDSVSSVADLPNLIIVDERAKKDDDVGGGQIEDEGDADDSVDPLAMSPERPSTQEYFCGLCIGDCETTYKTEALLEEHTNKAHRSISPPPRKKFKASPKRPVKRYDQTYPKIRTGPGFGDDRFGYDCPSCPHVRDYGVTAYAQHLAIHMRRPYKCRLCSALLPCDETSWEEHWNKEHSGIKHDSIRFIKINLNPGLIFKCEGCKIGFISQKQRNLHEENCPRKKAKEMIRTRVNKTFTPTNSKVSCITCKKSFRNKDEWRFHRLLLHPDVDRVSCCHCDMTFAERRLDSGVGREGDEERNDDKLMSHLLMSHGRRLYHECELCGIVFFSTEAETVKHFQERHGRKSGFYQCRLCPKSYTKLETYWKHFGSVHFDRNQSRFRYDCPNCPGVRSYPLEPFAHHLTLHQRRPFKCKECSVFLPDEKSVWKQHWKEKHSNVKQDYGSIKRQKLDAGLFWKCDGCLQGYKTEFERNKHEIDCEVKKASEMDRRGSANTVDCITCKRSFRNGDEWRLHRLLKHPDVDRLSCFYCDSFFGEMPKNGTKVERHDERFLDHIEEAHPKNLKRFLEQLYAECEDCLTFFNNAEQMKKHFQDKHGINAENEEKGIYICRLCEKKCISSAQLQKHLSNHFGQLEDKYDCVHCPDVQNYRLNAFAQHLSIHQRRPFRCSECKEFLPDKEEAWKEHWKQSHPQLDAEVPLEKKILIGRLNPGLIYKCAGCFSGYSTELERDTHEKKCSSPKQERAQIEKTCVTCKKVLRNINEWRLHRLLEHPDVDRTSCFYCDESFAEKTVEGREKERNDVKLFKHIKVHHRGCKYRYDGEECEACGLVFSKISDTLSHFKDKHGITDEKAYACRFCEVKTTRPGSLREHISVHFRAESLFCDLCGFKTLIERTLTDHKFRKHQLNEENLPVITCPVEGCSFNCLFKVSMKRHRENIHMPFGKFCDICGKGFKWTPEFENHKQICGRKLSSTFNNNFSVNRQAGCVFERKFNRFGKYDCPSCPEVKDYTLVAYTQHLLIHKERPYKCTNCAEFLANDRSVWEEHWLNQHSQSIYHFGSEEEAVKYFPCVPGKIYKCERCETGFETEMERNVHENTCSEASGLTNMQDFTCVCSTCQKTFRNPHELRFHRFLEHPEIDKFSCPFCHEYFGEETVDGEMDRNDPMLYNHIIKTHTNLCIGSRLFELCPHCGLLFDTKKKMSVHFKEKHGIGNGHVYFCRLCKVPKSDIRYLITHMKLIHFRTKDAVCDQCGVSFTHKNTLIEHKFTVHGVIEGDQEIKYCSVEGCNFKYISKRTLEGHMTKHKGFDEVCRFCGRGFRRKGDKNKHEQLHMTKGKVKVKKALNSVGKFNNKRKI